MHKNADGKTREERVKQSLEREKSVLEYANYIPIGNVVEKLKKWQAQGGDILYLSSHETQEDVDKDKVVLKKHYFPKGFIYWRQNGQSYADIAEKVIPNILIEDNCESIGGERGMTYPHIKPKLKEKIKSIKVKSLKE